MEQLKRILYRVFHPHRVIVLSGIPLTALLMLNIFTGSCQESVAAYVSYLISAYSVVIVCVRIGKHIKKKILIFASKNKYMHRYIYDISFRSHVSLCQSFTINIIYAVLYLCADMCACIWNGNLYDAACNDQTEKKWKK